MNPPSMRLKAPNTAQTPTIPATDISAPIMRLLFFRAGSFEVIRKYAMRKGSSTITLTVAPRDPDTNKHTSMSSAVSRCALFLRAK